MTRLQISKAMEWLRPVAIGVCVFTAYWNGRNAVQIFHLLGPGLTVIMCGSVAMESFLLGAAGSEKLGYQPDRKYQIQSALNNTATTITALIVYFKHWGPHAEAAVTLVMLCFFCLSAINHASSTFHGNRSFSNLLRPLLMPILAIVVLIPMWQALR